MALTRTLREKSDRLSKRPMRIQSARTTAGINGGVRYPDALDRMRQELGKSLDSRIIDAAGRRWRPDTHVEMLTRTKMMNTMPGSDVSHWARCAVCNHIRHGADSCNGGKEKII
ncbi:hypothetical protein P7H17_16575 [Paenibacillus larvae]|nr:hypothetical protein [Paenibacillus larvae]MDT2287323.1 hypothetical protein [Paenibacillus larvae]